MVFAWGCNRRWFLVVGPLHGWNGPTLQRHSPVMIAYVFCFVWCAVTGPKDGFCKVVGHQLPSKTRVTLTRLPAVATVAKCKGELSSSQDWLFHQLGWRWKAAEVLPLGMEVRLWTRTNVRARRAGALGTMHSDRRVPCHNSSGLNGSSCLKESL